MTEEKDIKINETHICVLKKKKNKVYVDFQELQFEFKNELNQLERMARNPNRTIYELEQYVLNSSLSPLLNRFNYCESLTDTYQGISSISTLDYKSYSKTIEELREEINTKENLTNVEVRNEIEEYQNSEKQFFCNKIKKRLVPFMLNQAYDDLTNHNEVLAYSHRKVGWSFPEFKINEDFDLIFKSNFGYGSASYFFTNIRYKGIDILPYSDWIRYRYAKKTDIIRYTRKFKICNSSWEHSMNFASELFTHSQESPKDFINKWILNECIEMVEGLEDLLNRNDKIEMIQSYFNPKVKTIVSELELIDFKGEKISGALTFLEKIELLIVFSDKIPALIERIFKCNMEIYPDLLKKAHIFQKEVSEIKEKLSLMEPEWKKVKAQYNDYSEKKNIMIEEYKKDNDIEVLNKDQEEEIELNFKIDYPDYYSCEIVFRNLLDKSNSLHINLHEKEHWHSKFASYVKIIETHLKKLEMPLNTNVA